MTRLAILTRHEFRRASKSLVPRLVFVAMPVALAAFLQPTFVKAYDLTGKGPPDGITQSVPGMAVLFAFVVLIYFGYTAFDDFGFGMWDRLRVSGVRSIETLSAKAIVMGAHLLVHLALVFVAGVALLGLEIRGSWGQVVVLLVATAVVCVSYAFMAFAFSGSNALYNAFCYIGAMALAALGGGLVPSSLLPGWAQSIAYATPTYWSLDGLQRAISPNPDGATFLRHLVALAGFGAVFLLLGIWRYEADADREAFSL